MALTNVCLDLTPFLHYNFCLNNRVNFLCRNNILMMALTRRLQTLIQFGLIALVVASWTANLT
jgi:hypothetical protein